MTGAAPDPVGKAEVCVVGCGVVGGGWALAFARAGHRVALHDSSPGQAERCLESIAGALGGLERHGALTDPWEVLARLRPAADLEEAVAGAAYVQESVIEDAAVKTRLFQDMDAVASPDAILASSTSAILPTRFLEGVAGRRRCLVAHPFNPPHLIPLVEVVMTPWVDEDVVDATVALLRSVGQAPIVLRREIEGFVGNRLQAAVVNEAMNLVRLGVVSPADLDRCMKDGLGRRWAFLGPLETMDLNAPAGFAEYADKFGASYQQLGRQLGVAEPWSDLAAQQVEDWRRSETPAGGVAAIQAWRDLMLLRLSDWLAAQPASPRV